MGSVGGEGLRVVVKNVVRESRLGVGKYSEGRDKEGNVRGVNVGKFELFK